MSHATLCAGAGGDIREEPICEGINILIWKNRGKRMNYTYILRCSDESLYTGWTNDLRKRIRAHNEGKGAKYTKSRVPVSLVYFEEYETKQEAQKREYAIKRLTKKQKLSLILEMDSSALHAVIEDINT